MMPAICKKPLKDRKLSLIVNLKVVLNPDLC